MNLRELDLNFNDFEGLLPSCLANMTQLRIFDISSNRFNGSIDHLSPLPSLKSLEYFDLSHWIGNLSSLSILLLKANYLHGQIPLQLCLLEELSLLDLSHTSFSGQIPCCLSNFTSEPSYNKSESSNFAQIYFEISDMLSFLHSTMIMNSKFFDFYYDDFMFFNVDALQEVEFSTKHNTLSYKGDIHNYMSGIDLSCNKLEGEIPTELGDLSDIHALNLSFNNLTGSIPTEFSKLKQIESLDLSHNNLDGIIPPQLVELTH
ncbi:hypothetical protein F2P56_012952 [Juglans regia]|uniref:Uncharacterized protein n=1 Tax=Juglans regia TaxID=51240 RepID=A0A833XJM4_JUGRE|nr:hypothetical protein F2P56_012952 [Juglans regia]